MVGGYAGKILFVDLTTGSMREEAPPESLYRDFIGGTGLIQIQAARWVPN